MAQKKEKTEKQNKINFEQILCNFAGVPMKNGDQPITLKYVAVTSVVTEDPHEQGVTGVEKFSRYQLAKRIYNGDATLSKNEIEKVKALIGRHFIPIIVGAAFDALDGQEPPIQVAPSETEAA